MRGCWLTLLAGLALFQGKPELGWAQMPSGGDDAQVHAAEGASQSSVGNLVMGTVLDPSGSAIAHAKVVLTGTGGQPFAETTTDAMGAFRIEAAPSGTYVLKVQAKGFQDFRRDLILKKKAGPAIRIVLSIAAEKQVVNVNADQAVPVVSTEVSENQNANTIDRARFNLKAS